MCAGAGRHASRLASSNRRRIRSAFFMSEKKKFALGCPLPSAGVCRPYPWPEKKGEEDDKDDEGGVAPAMTAAASAAACCLFSQWPPWPRPPDSRHRLQQNGLQENTRQTSRASCAIKSQLTKRKRGLLPRDV